MSGILEEINIPKRVLMGPGPSNVHPRVLKAMSMPMIGHLDPVFLKIMDQTMELLRKVFQTKNCLTIPVSGTGSAGGTGVPAPLAHREPSGGYELGHLQDLRRTARVHQLRPGRPLGGAKRPHQPERPSGRLHHAGRPIGGG